MLGSYFPPKNLVPRSERYILGPAGLRHNAPHIPESAVAFHFGTEGEVARYSVLQNEPKDEANIVIFSFPTPQMARQQVPEFQEIPGASVKRTGPLVAVVLGLPDRAAAGQLLNQINYEASVTGNESMPLILRPETAAPDGSVDHYAGRHSTGILPSIRAWRLAAFA